MGKQIAALEGSFSALYRQPEADGIQHPASYLQSTVVRNLAPETWVQILLLPHLNLMVWEVICLTPHTSCSWPAQWTGDGLGLRDLLLGFSEMAQEGKVSAGKSCSYKKMKRCRILSIGVL